MIHEGTFSILVPTIEADDIAPIIDIGNSNTNYYTDGNLRATNCCSCDKA